MNTTLLILCIVLFVFLVVLSAFFSGIEIIYATLNRKKMEREAKKGSKCASGVIKVLNHYSTMLTTVLIGNDLANIAASSLATVIALNVIPEKYSPAVVSTVVVTFVILIFGEIIPKTIFPKFGYNLSKKFLFPLQFFQIIFYPIVFVVTKFVDWIAVLWTPKDKTPVATGDELITMTEELEENGMIDSSDEKLIKSAIEFTDASAYEIMIPRVDMKTIDIEDSLDEIFEDEDLLSYSRIPVYKETVDHIIGILSTTALLKQKLNHQQLDIESILTQPIFVFRTMPISKMLQMLRINHAHVAIVLDEFGGVDGMVTMEDILEELVGEIWDESDEVTTVYQKLSDTEYIVDGDMNIYDFFDLVGITNDEYTDYATVGGWCIDNLNKFPQYQDEFVYSFLHVKILDTENHRVGHIKVDILPVDDIED